MARFAFFGMMAALLLQVWLLGSLFWLFYWGKMVRTRGYHGWRGAPLAFGPLLVLVAMCLVGLVRMGIHAWH